MNDQAGEKKRLVDAYDRLSVWMKIFTAFVAVGLVVEYLPDVIRAIRTFTFPVPLIGPVLITVGVAGELFILIWSSRYETKIREINDSITSEATGRATKAEQAAAEANLARARLEQRFTARTLSAESVERIKRVLVGYEGLRIDVFAWDNHVLEVQILADTLNAALLDAGLRSVLWHPSASSRMTGVDITFGIARDSTEEEKAQLQRLAWALAGPILDSGIQFSVSHGGFAKDDPRVPNSARGWASWKVDDVASGRIQIVQRVVTDPWFTDRPVTPPQA